MCPKGERHTLTSEIKKEWEARVTQRFQWELLHKYWHPIPCLLYHVDAL
jgi:hypothetical protein